MKVRQNTPDLLVIEQSPLATGGFLAGLSAIFVVGLCVSAVRGDWLGVGAAAICLAVTVPIFLWVAEWSRLTLDRVNGSVTLRRIQITHRQSLTRPLDVLEGIEIEAAQGGEGDSRRLMLRLVGAQGLIPVTGHFIGGPAPARCLRAATDWLRQTS